MFNTHVRSATKGNVFTLFVSSPGAGGTPARTMTWYPPTSTARTRTGYPTLPHSQDRTGYPLPHLPSQDQDRVPPVPQPGQDRVPPAPSP